MRQQFSQHDEPTLKFKTSPAVTPRTPPSPNKEREIDGLLERGESDRELLEQAIFKYCFLNPGQLSAVQILLYY